MSPEVFIDRTLEGGYKVEKLLGVGAFGSVFLATDTYDQSPVAIKLFEDTPPQELAGFKREAQTLGRLRHPNIVQSLWADVEQVTLHEEKSGLKHVSHHPFIVMEYVSGGDLARYQQKNIPLPPQKAIGFLMQAVQGVQHAHDRGTIHRDLKPANLLLKKHPEDTHLDVLVSDFGIAIKAHSQTSLRTHGIAGTPNYMAPEQTQGKTVKASDQYALGVIAYEWLTGRRPFYGNPQQLEYAHAIQPPPELRKTLKQQGNGEWMPLIIDTLEEVVMKALAKLPAERYESVVAFGDALQENYTRAREQEALERTRFDQGQLPTGTLDKRRTGSYDRAISAMKPQPEATPRTIEEAVKLCKELFKREKYTELLQASEQAIALDPDNADAWVYKGVSLCRFGKWEETLSVYDRAIELDPDIVLKADAMRNKADSLNKLGRHEEALQTLEKALQIDPTYVDALFDKGIALPTICATR